MTIKNPVEWGISQISNAFTAIGSAGPALHHMQETVHSPAPTIRRISMHDVTDALAEGFRDFANFRSDVVFICVFYPLVGLLLSQYVFGQNMLPLLFPIAAGFALIGPFAAIGLYEMSRRHEKGLETSWIHAFDVVRSPAIGSIAAMGILLVAIFLAWLQTAWGIYDLTLGPDLPTSISTFANDVLTTAAGHTMIVLGIGIGFVFALIAMSVSVFSFPLLLDRDVGLDTAFTTSIRAVWMNIGPMALWGFIVASTLALGSIPMLIGLAIVMPTLGHATWHLYRKVIAP
ncbi:MAG: DUF2189 domain-containing protein [Parvibaculaceae bacterium]